MFDFMKKKVLKKKRVDLKISNWFKLNQLDQTFKQTLHFIKHSRRKYNS